MEWRLGRNKYRMLIWYIYLIIFPISAQQYKFYDANAGLSSSLINQIVQDGEGYIWIATEDGLNRFDGTHFTVYRNIPGDSTSLPDNYVKSILADRKQRLWVSTSNGLCLYDQKTDRFHPYPLALRDSSQQPRLPLYLMEDRRGYIWFSTSGKGVAKLDAEKGECTYFDITNSGICSNHINQIYEDRFGNIWFGSGREGLSVYNPDNGVFRTFHHQPENKNGLSSDAVSSICEDTEGNVWIGTLTGGVNIYSFARQTFSRLELPVSGINNEIGSLLKDRENNIWVGTMGSGFIKYLIKEKRFDTADMHTPLVNMARSKVQAMYEDKQGNIWMALFQKGLFMIPHINSIFTNYTFNPYTEEQLVGTEAIQFILSDSQGELWVATDGDGLYRFTPDRKQRIHYDKNSRNVLPGNIILSLYEDCHQNIWIGTYLNGALRYNRQTDKFDMHLRQDTSPSYLLSNHVADFTEDASGRLYIATNGGDINIYDPRKHTFEYIVKGSLDNDSTGLIDNWCNLVRFDRDSLLWIATYRGLCTYNKQSKQFVYYTTANGKLPNDIVISLEEGSDGRMWAGTQDGLVRIDKHSGEVRMYSIVDGLPNSVINGIKEDGEGNFWISTHHGLSMYNPSTKSFTNYTTADGLLTNELNRNAFFRNKDGELFIGSMKGLISFFPSQYRQEKVEPLNLVFTNLYVFNEPVKVGKRKEKGILASTVNYTDKVVLTHRQNSFSVGFSAIEYTFPDKVRYEVMLKGFDNQWRPAPNGPVTYTNLDAGTYTLFVKAWINDKEKALIRSIKIKTLPSWWTTTGAKSVYFLLFIVTTYLAYSYIRARMVTRRQEQLMQAKLQFFTDISHEIRTPLTLILTPLSKLIGKNTDATLSQVYHTMYKNGARLLTLVNQIMDLRALEFGKKKLAVEETNISIFLKELKNSFANLAEEKNLLYTFTSQPEEITGYIDQDILTKIFFNLISNAFKYTEEGAVNITLKTTAHGQLQVAVHDTGKGIPLEEQPLIFERFYRVSSTGTKRGNSSGIGLHLTRKLVDLHHGKITLESSPGKGSCFYVTIPYRKKDYKPKEIAVQEETTSSFSSSILSKNCIFPTTTKRATSMRPERYTLLLVEDNADIRKLLVLEFTPTYNVLEAENGREALRLIFEQKPSLIISDVVMPEMDGLELCEKLRNNELTCHIPFIMLTARATTGQQIAGLEHGADAYIPKPFNMPYLHATVKRLLESHETLWKKYAPATSPAEREKDEKFTPNDKLLKKLNEAIDMYLDNPELSVDVLCCELGMSRTNLNRKMRELTGDSPASYIRQLRLHRAAQLLKSHRLTVSEIAFQVGFSSPSYFSQAFRDYYGITPTEYMNMEKSGST